MLARLYIPHRVQMDDGSWLPCICIPLRFDHKRQAPVHVDMAPPPMPTFAPVALLDGDDTPYDYLMDEEDDDL